MEKKPTLAKILLRQTLSTLLPRQIKKKRRNLRQDTIVLAATFYVGTFGLDPSLGGLP
jgi:hypothetical protein